VYGSVGALYIFLHYSYAAFFLWVREFSYRPGPCRMAPWSSLIEDDYNKRLCKAGQGMGLGMATAICRAEENVVGGLVPRPLSIFGFKHKGCRACMNHRGYLHVHFWLRRMITTPLCIGAYYTITIRVFLAHANICTACRMGTLWSWVCSPSTGQSRAPGCCHSRFTNKCCTRRG